MIRATIAPPQPRCARCDGTAITVIVEFSVVQVYLDLCDEHLNELLRGARRIP